MAAIGEETLAFPEGKVMSKRWSAGYGYEYEVEIEYFYALLIWSNSLMIYPLRAKMDPMLF